MPDERAALVAELFKSAVEREQEQWPSFLEAECSGDAVLRGEVESLLRHHQRSLPFLERPALHQAADSFLREGTLHAGQTIGDYEILSLIGSGGMGDVYLAEDTHLRRKVALKLVRAAMSTDDIVARFRYEEQILASLNDPNIAHLYGGGVTANGTPFFVMEYVEGLRIDEYCTRHDLTIAARLTLFRKVCSAVHYAHQHLVIHRDLKPSNILVTEAGEPKLLDFGIAKLLKADESAPALTLVGVMTPDYASPEQVRGESITTASDVYSLGVIFYELLTGCGPYQVKTRNPGEIARAITEQIPARPSTAVTKFKDNQPSAIKNQKSLRGDLDNIALMGLRKEPSRRYTSVAQFSADIQRHLEGRPVIARKDTFAYRTSKYLKRHPFRVAAAALILLSLVGGMMTTTWQAQAARREKSKAEHERTRAEEVKNALVRMLNYSTPVVDSPQNNGQKTVKEILDEAAKRLDAGEFASQPEIKVELEQILSACYAGQGNLAAARKHGQEYLNLHRKLYGENDAQTLLASAFLLFSQGNLTESEERYRKIVLSMREEKRKGNVKPETLADVLNTFGFLRRTQGDSKEAELLFRETLALKPEMPKESLYLLGSIRSTLASAVADQGRFEEALQLAREAVQEYRQRGETDTPNFSFTLNVLGGFLTEKGDYTKADKTLREAEVIQRKFLNPSNNLWLGDNLRNQAISFYQQGRYTESLDKVTETLRIYRETFGIHYDNYPTALITKGLSQAKTGQVEEGEGVLREAVKIRTESLPKEHYWVALANSALGECLTIQRRYDEAEPLLVGSYESLKHSQGPSNPRTRLALQRLVELYENWQKPDLAVKYRALPL